MNVLITGVAGLIGSRLSDWICKNKPEYKVIGIDDLSGGYKENINPKVNFYNIDLVNGPIENVFKKNEINYVFHFAAYAAEGLSPFIRAYNYDNNLKATARIVNQCIKYDINRLVFTSSLAVYGHGNGGVFDEKLNPSPIDPYGVAKYACEMDIRIAGEQHGLDWCVIRPHNVYGVKQNIWDKYRNVLGIWMYQHINNKPMTIFGSGEQTRAFSYIDDTLEPLWNAMIRKKASKEIINLGGTKGITINEACSVLKDIMGGGEVIYFSERHEVKHSVPTFKKSVDILNFKENTTLKEGLKEMWKWARKQPHKERFIWSSYELEKGLYSFWKK